MRCLLDANIDIRIRHKDDAALNGSPKESRRIFQVLEPAVRMRFAQFDLDSDTRQLLRDGEEVHLSPKAFAVLSVLLAKRPNVVAMALWRDLARRLRRRGNLNVLVGEIRQALDDDPQSPRFIRTVHGVGYAFCSQVTGANRPAAAAGRGRAPFWLAWKTQTFALEKARTSLVVTPMPGVGRSCWRVAPPCLHSR